MSAETSNSIDQLVSEDKVIFKEKYVTAYYSPELKIIGLVWDGLFSKEQYIDTFVRLIEHAKKNPVTGFYSDIRKQGVVNVEARKYFEKEISPTAAKMGIERTGVVSDASPFKKYYLNTLIKMTGRPTKICSDPDDAIQYILEG